MTLNIHHRLKPLSCLALSGVLCGCEVVSTALLFADLPPYGEPSKAGPNYLEPIILASDEGMIRIKYLTVSDRARHEQVIEMMNEHCGDSYTETSRVELHGWTTVEADCK